MRASDLAMTPIERRVREETLCGRITECRICMRDCGARRLPSQEYTEIADYARVRGLRLTE